MVVGARTGARYWQGFIKAPARIVFKLIVEFTTGQRVPDVNSGLRVFRKSTVLPYLGDICNGFSFTTTITLIYLLTGKSLQFVPIPYAKRSGRSKVRHIRDGIRTLQYITECIVRYNPLKLFLVLMMCTALMGGIFAIWLGLWAIFLTLVCLSLQASLAFMVEAQRVSHRG